MKRLPAPSNKMIMYLRNRFRICFERFALDKFLYDFESELRVGFFMDLLKNRG